MKKKLLKEIFNDPVISGNAYVDWSSGLFGVK